MHSLIQDLKYAVRTLGRVPIFTTVAIATLALGIGANAALFSVIDGILLEPLPYPDPDRVVLIRNTYRGGASSSSVPDFLDRERDGATLEAVAAVRRTDFNLTAQAAPVHVEGSDVTASFFDVLAVEPALGRVFTAEEDQPGRNDVVVLAHGAWKLYFGGDAAIIGNPVRLDGRAYTVVGIMPETFRAPLGQAEIWRPIAFTEAQKDPDQRGNEFLTNIARYRTGVGLEEVDAEMRMLAARAVESAGRRREFLTNARFSADVVPLRDVTVGETRTPLIVLFVAVGMVLMIALANVANLMVARSTVRRREIFIRTTLGAGRSRIVRQLLTESVLLSLAGGLAGLLMAYWGVRAFVGLGLPNVPRLEHIGVDSGVVLFTGVLSLVTGLVFGLLPALSASRLNLSSLGAGGRAVTASSRGIGNAVVVFEVAVALVLLVGAGLMVGSVGQLLDVDPGFETKERLAFRLSLPPGMYGEPEQKVAFYEQLLERLAAMPGVRDVGVTTLVPFDSQNATATFHVEGYDEVPGADPPGAEFRHISGGYPETLGIPLLRGRTFDGRDTYSSQLVVLVDQKTADFFWPGEDPLGQLLRFGPSWREVVGVVGTIRNTGLDVEGQFQIYAPYVQEPISDMVVAIHSGEGIAETLQTAATGLAELDSDLPLFDVRPLADRVGDSLAARRYSMFLLAGFGLTGLLLAAIGLYGVIAYSVRQRTREIGIRMALGAKKRDVFRMVVGQGLSLTGAGVVLGSVAALLLTRFLESLLYGVTSRDPVTFVAVTAFLALTAIAAAFIPAARAAGLDPALTLRGE